MNRRKAVGLIGLPAYAQAASSARDRFIGVWKLVSCRQKSKDGKLSDLYGPNPIGRITYDKAGRMSAQLMRRGRRSTVPPGTGLGRADVIIEEMREAAGGYIAYFGTFDVDEASKMVIHHVQACLVPSWVGTDLKRAYRFYSNRLALTADQPDGQVELVWEREPD